jgi:hypothetical protein
MLLVRYKRGRAARNITARDLADQQDGQTDGYPYYARGAALATCVSRGFYPRHWRASKGGI